MIESMNDQIAPASLSCLAISMICIIVSHPLILYPSFLAISQMHGQQSFWTVRAHFIQLRSAVWSFPFSLAAWSQYWKASLVKYDTFLNFSFAFVDEGSRTGGALWEGNCEKKGNEENEFEHLWLMIK